MKKLVLIALLILASGAQANHIDSLIIEVFTYPAYTPPGWARWPLSDPNRNHIGALSDSARIYWFMPGGTSTPNIMISEDGGATKADSLNINPVFGAVSDHAHFVVRNDSIFTAYTGNSDGTVELAIIDATSTMSIGSLLTPTVEASAPVFATRFHPLPTGDSSAIIWRAENPRTYDVSANWTDDYGATAGARAFIENVENISGNGGRLGACWFNGSIMAGIFDRDVYLGVSWWDRAAQSWTTPDTLWAQLLQRWYDLQSINDTTIFVAVAGATGTIDTLKYAAKHLGQENWTYGILDGTLISDDPQSMVWSAVEASSRMVVFYMKYHANGNYSINMKWFSPEDSLGISTSTYTIVGDSVQPGYPYDRFAATGVVPASHGDVSYLYYSDPASTTVRIVRVTFVSVSEELDNYKPQTVIGGAGLGGAIW